MLLCRSRCAAASEAASVAQARVLVMQPERRASRQSCSWRAHPPICPGLSVWYAATRRPAGH
jgi:hypothetical protein